MLIESCRLRDQHSCRRALVVMGGRGMYKRYPQTPPLSGFPLFHRGRRARSDIPTTARLLTLPTALEIVTQSGNEDGGRWDGESANPGWVFDRSILSAINHSSTTMDPGEQPPPDHQFLAGSKTQETSPILSGVSKESDRNEPLGELLKKANAE
ncbi:uncharacterized protein N7459_003795 [Penicillium hispanicum]|uniref:uncharacterized protein n=1 Tax=Penicillium hispanicum TaxID=1080232 RepID=UPI00254094D4|nr:uncharacterized protein N7459_003795 [Penicillium hispanicum]KAJ5583995.1 hypothetical protein N7459_003795 [Penicillium hispanicum]